MTDHPTPQPVSQQAEWLIVKRDLYFRPDRSGYTGIRDHAGLYTRAEADEYADDADISFVRLTDAPEFTKAAYSDLVIAHLIKQRDEYQERALHAETVLAEQDDLARSGVRSVRLEARPADDSHDWTEIYPSQLEWAAKQGHQVRAIEGEGTLWGQIAAIYGNLDAEDCRWIDREWAKMRGYIVPTDGTSSLSSADQP